MNRSAKDGIRSSPQYGGEGVTHSPIAPRCLLTARYGRFMRDPRRPGQGRDYDRDREKEHDDGTRSKTIVKERE
jgi:hypothetical protein